MLHPSYSDLIQVANSEVEPGEANVVNSRYSIVMAIAKRARQIIDGDEPLVYASVDKPLSIAVEELNKGEINKYKNLFAMFGKELILSDELYEELAETALKEGFNSAVDRENVLDTLKQAELSLKSTSVTPAQQEAKKNCMD